MLCWVGAARGSGQGSACRCWGKFRPRPAWRSWPIGGSPSGWGSPIRLPASPCAISRGPSPLGLPAWWPRNPSPAHPADVRLLAAAVMMLQGSPDLRAGLDTLYGGDFPRAAADFERPGAAHPAGPAPSGFQSRAHILWAAARESAGFETPRLESLLRLGPATERRR